MKTKIRGFFGNNRNGKPCYFGGPPNQFYVVEFADDGIFFANCDGSRTPSTYKDDERVFAQGIKQGAWLKFEGGNPFPTSTTVRYGLERWVTRAVDGEGKRMKPHWRNEYWDESLEQARADVQSFNPRRKWRIVRVTREVLP